jgi:hypothetical protein
MSFLNFDITALPKSCQRNISRVGRCNCRSCIGVAVPTSSSSSSSKSSRIMNKLWSINNSKNSSMTSIGESGDTMLGPTEFHLLTIVSGIDKLRLERDVKEAADTASIKSISNCETKEKRKTPCSSDDDDEMEGTEDDLDVLREVQYTVQVVLQRKKLVLSSRIQRRNEWMEKMKGEQKPVSSWDRLRLGLKERMGSGKARCRRIVENL